MALALFDLDNTLLANDSDYLWGLFLADCGLVDLETYQAQNEAYFRAYEAGDLDIHAFLRFSLAPLAANPTRELCTLRDRFITEHIAPVVAPGAADLLQKHRDRGDTLVIITATNRFVTGPIAALLGVDHLLATEPQMGGGAFTGSVIDPPCFREGKIACLEAWCRIYGRTTEEISFYSDSHNDLPLLQRAHYPVAVDPDARLAALAREQNWPVISLR